MKHSKTFRIAALLLALTIVTSALAFDNNSFARFTSTEESPQFYVSFSQNLHQATTSWSTNIPGYWAFFIVGGAGGGSLDNRTGFGGAGGRVTGVVRVGSGQTLSFAPGTGGGTRLNPGLPGGGNGGNGSDGGGAGGGYSLLTLGGTVVALAGGGGGTSDDGPTLAPKSGGAGGGGAASALISGEHRPAVPPHPNPLVWNSGLTIGSFRIAQGQHGAYAGNPPFRQNAGRGGDNTTDIGSTANQRAHGVRGGGSAGNAAGGGGGGFTGGGQGNGSGTFGGWVDASGGGGSSALNSNPAIVPHVSVPAGIPGWTGAWANPGPRGTAARHNGFGFFFYLGPALPGEAPPFSNFS